MTTMRGRRARATAASFLLAPPRRRHLAVGGGAGGLERADRPVDPATPLRQLVLRRQQPWVGKAERGAVDLRDRDDGHPLRPGEGGRACDRSLRVVLAPVRGEQDLARARGWASKRRRWNGMRGVWVQASACHPHSPGTLDRLDPGRPCRASFLSSSISSRRAESREGAGASRSSTASGSRCRRRSRPRSSRRWPRAAARRFHDEPQRPNDRGIFSSRGVSSRIERKIRSRSATRRARTGTPCSRRRRSAAESRR